MTRILTLFFALIVLLAVFSQCSDINTGDRQPTGNSTVNHASTKQIDSSISLVDWIRENEDTLVRSLRKALSELDSINPNDKYIKQSIVVTEYDRSIMGELARRVKLIDSTLDVNYTVMNGIAEKPIICPQATGKDGYVDLNWKAGKRIELKHLFFEYADTLSFERKRQWK